MEHQKILNLMNEPNDPKFVTKKSNIANDQPDGSYMQEIKLSKIQKF